MGTKSVNLHEVIKAFLDVREGTGGYVNAKQHLSHFLALPNCRMSELSEDQLQGVVNKRRAEGKSHNAIMVSYWRAVVAFAAAKKWTTGPTLPSIKPLATRPQFASCSRKTTCGSVQAALDVMFEWRRPFPIFGRDIAAMAAATEEISDVQEVTEWASLQGGIDISIREGDCDLFALLATFRDEQASMLLKLRWL